MNEAYEFFRSGFVGQESLIKELSIIAVEMKEGTNLNLALLAPSGYGKTYLSYGIGNYVDDEGTRLYTGEEILNFNKDKRVIVWDEAHELTSPEKIYPFMDSGNYIFIILTNEYDRLKEPLINRCINLSFEAYSVDELAIISRNLFKRKKIKNIPYEYCQVIAERSRGVPREVKITSKRLAFIFKQQGIPANITELKFMILEILKIDEGGMTPLDRQYLEFVRRHAPVGLETIMFSLQPRISRRIIRSEIEPFLIHKGLLQITNKGRIAL